MKYINKNFNINLILKVILIIFVIHPFFILNSFYIYLYELVNNLKINYQINQLEIYYNLCNKGLLINKRKFKISYKPKISIISTIFNNENKILRLLRSIQNQFFNDIEIIFIDDHSKDNSVKIVQECLKKDERIILIKQKINKGTLISRNIGILKSKGEYIILPDSDDMLSYNILKLCYSLAKNHKYDFL